MVVGRGASDPDANSNVAKVTRLLWEGMGFGWSETCYSGVTFPLVEPGLEHAARLGFRRIVVFRSEEHTSELQSIMRISYAVFCLKKYNTKTTHLNTHY